MLGKQRVHKTVSGKAAKSNSLRSRLGCETLEDRSVPTFVSFSSAGYGHFYYDETQVNVSQATQSIPVSDLWAVFDHGSGQWVDNGNSTINFAYGQEVGANFNFQHKDYPSLYPIILVHVQGGVAQYTHPVTQQFISSPYNAQSSTMTVTLTGTGTPGEVQANVTWAGAPPGSSYKITYLFTDNGVKHNYTTVNHPATGTHVKKHSSTTGNTINVQVQLIDAITGQLINSAINATPFTVP